MHVHKEDQALFHSYIEHIQFNVVFSFNISGILAYYYVKMSF